MAEALVLSASSGEEMETDGAGERTEKGAQKSKRISRAPIDSEDSESEQEKGGETEDQQGKARKEAKSMKEQKKREKSQRHREKKEKRSKAVEKLKKKERFSEMDEVSAAWPFLSVMVLSSSYSLNMVVCQGSSGVAWKYVERNKRCHEKFGNGT